jgi:hypothetical protein
MAYGKYTAAILLPVGSGMMYMTLAFPTITADNWLNLPFLYGRSVLFFLISFLHIQRLF